MDKTPSEPKSLLELKAKKVTTAEAPAPESLEDRVNAAYRSAGGQRPATPNNQEESGASAAAGVLTAVDEDEEGAEEAEAPRDFDYHSDGDAED